MSDRQGWTSRQLSLVSLIVVAFCGFLGFVIIYHYANYERVNESFAIVVDAGSTQTRSGLFTIDLDVARLRKWTDELESEELLNSSLSSRSKAPLTELLHVQQVSGCVNGGPLTAIQSQAEANELAMKCVYKFSQHIKRLDFASVSDEDEEDGKPNSEKLIEINAFNNHRINSKTHLYLGATAGMRALEKLNETRAHEKIHWIDQAFNASNGLLESSPFVNKGFVGIIEGADEAAFGWLAVNFVCDKLEAKHKLPVELPADPLQALPVYSIDGHPEPKQQVSTISASKRELQSHADSVGTLELGGASAQMAYQAADWFSRGQIQDSGLEEQDLDLFNEKYRLATRSDLCMGMSQAVLRVHYVLLRDSYPGSSNISELELENPCMQKSSRISLGSKELGETFRSPCLSSSNQDVNRANFRDSLGNKTWVRFVGTADVAKCNIMLSNLLELNKCRHYFSLCPPNRISQAPPEAMPFVTISGYNKALKVLNLNKLPSANTGVVSQTIADKLGGQAINHTKFRSKSRDFCAIDVSEFPLRFPKLNKLFYSINCMQLIYIDKLLTEFYLFDPASSWNQIKFLLFEPGKQQQADQTDISWTMGLLLNATSEQFKSQSELNNKHVFYHHGSSIVFILRATILLMIACVLLAISFVVGSLIAVRRRLGRNGLYEIHP